MADPFLGEIKMGGWNFAPRGYALCDGQLLPIAQYTALFSLLGTMFGGDGRTTFGLPELRGRVPMHQGTGPGLSPRSMGQKGGEETHTLSIAEMPAHNHSVRMAAESRPAATNDPNGNILAAGVDAYRANSPRDDVLMDANALQQQTQGGSQSHNNMQPFQVVNYVIALQGLYPSRS